MGIFSRMSDIINSNINALLEKAEDPEKIVRLMIQEMEDTLVEVRSSAAKTIAEKKERSRRLNWLEQEELDWERKAELAIRKGREDLAKAALVEKSKVGERVEILRKELDVVEDTLSKLNDDISKLQAKLNDAKARQRSLTVRHTTAKTQIRVRGQLHDDKIDDVLNRFELAEKRIEEVESRAESMNLGRQQDISAQIDDLETNERVAAELEALRARVKAESSSKAEPKSEEG